jgi:ribonuclease BN (tRNA processing enzyme)
VPLSASERQSEVVLARMRSPIRITISMGAAIRSQHNDSITGLIRFLILVSLLAAQDISQAMGSVSCCNFWGDASNRPPKVSWFATRTMPIVFLWTNRRNKARPCTRLLGAGVYRIRGSAFRDDWRISRRNMGSHTRVGLFRTCKMIVLKLGD